MTIQDDLRAAIKATEAEQPAAPCGTVERPHVIAPPVYRYGGRGVCHSCGRVVTVTPR